MGPRSRPSAPAPAHGLPPAGSGWPTSAGDTDRVATLRPVPAPRIGLLGGTFDPPHLGHLIVAEIARVRLELDVVRFVVAGEPWMKGEVSAADGRCRMVELAIEGEHGFELDRSEIDRPGPTYTIDTLETLTSEVPGADLFFLAGADAIEKLPLWNDAEKCLELATFVAVSRAGYSASLEGPLLDRVVRLDVPQIAISSTDLRRRFREGDAVRYQLPEAVEDHIRRRGLYGARP